jgi:hypothetical protein
VTTIAAEELNPLIQNTLFRDSVPDNRRDGTGMNPFLLFFSSLLPWNDFRPPNNPN